MAMSLRSRDKKSPDQSERQEELSSESECDNGIFHEMPPVMDSTKPSTSTAQSPPPMSTEEVFGSIMSTMSSLKSAVDELMKNASRNNDAIFNIRSQLEGAYSHRESLPNPPEATINPLTHANVHLPLTPSTRQGFDSKALPQADQLPPVAMSLPCRSTTMHQLPYANTMPIFTTADSQHMSSAAYLTQPNRMSTNSEVMGRLYPLPNFDGKPEDWPLFLANFNDTTMEFGYNNRQNLMRLQKALQGHAKAAVVSMMIFPDNVPQIISELQFNFGRPDILIRSQLEKVKSYPTITEGRLEGVLGLANCVKNIVAFFKASNCAHHLLNPMLLEQMVMKLPLSKQYEWAKHSSSIMPFSNVEHFAVWISDLARFVTLLPNTGVGTNDRRQQQQQQQQQQRQHTPPRRVLHGNDIQNEGVQCLQCKDKHDISKCGQFLNLSVDDKWKQVKRLRICFACLRKGHGLAQCRKRKACDVNGCLRYHHPLLHQDARVMTSVSGSYSGAIGSHLDVTCSQSGARGDHILQCHQNESMNQLFKILPIKLFGPNGTVTIYALLDEGSSVSLLEDDVARSLGLKGHRSSITLQWYDNVRKTESSRKVNCEISANTANAEKYSMKNVLTVAELSLPVQSFEKQKYEYLRSVPIADYVNERPSMLIGLDNCFLSVSEEVIEMGPNLPIASSTKLGWVVYGPTKGPSVSVARICHISETQALNDIRQMVEDYFSIENFGVKPTNLVLESDESLRAKHILEKATKKVEDHYETGLLWKNNEIVLPESYQMAKRRLWGVENKMSKDPAYAVKYRAEMEKYISKGYAKLLSSKEVDADGQARVWYLPRFGVVNPHKPGKLRIVFDAAALSSNTSLNSVLLKGPEHAKSLQTILFQFRQGRVAVAGDIREMFSQVSIIAEDQHSQRFLWRDGRQGEPIRTYVMKSMIFGAICSPCCAEYVKNINAKQFERDKPRGVKAVTNQMYVDDLVISFDTPDEALSVTREAISINAAAGFKLVNFSSNCSELEESLNNHLRDDTTLKMERLLPTEKILGLYWNKNTDCFEFHTKFYGVDDDVINGRRSPTKREILSVTMSIFDPFGFLSNFTIFSKLLLQKLWKLGVQWDEKLPRQILDQWNIWWKDFQKVKDFSVPRCYSDNLRHSADIQLHIFVDASSVAFAAVAYLRVECENGVHVSFVAAKSRCAPPRGMTIPRLELQAAVLGCRLRTSIEESHEFDINRVILWSDSKTVVLWIQSSIREYKQFVACRIAEILSTTTPDQWRWIPSEFNAADDATRAKNHVDFTSNSRWLQGPTFLKFDESQWPSHISFSKDDYCDSEDRPSQVLHLCQTDEYPVIKFKRFSNYLKLKRTVAWMLRFINNTRPERQARKSEELVAMEIDAAEKIICRIIQEEVYSPEISCLANGKPLPKTSSINQLSPCIDDDLILRVNGRIDNAYCLPDSARRPIILPSRHPVTILIIEYYHRIRHHQNHHVVINEIRQRFWIPNLRSTLKFVKSQCPVCIRISAKPSTPIMGQLPIDRLTPYVRPFSYVGLDYCGPFTVTIGRRVEKRWIALFTCLGTRALHLEMAGDLSTDSFLLCLRNFVNRRGMPVRIRSDNGTNFIGAQKEIVAETRFFDFTRIQDHLSRNNVEWIFNCPANPHAGGCWERLVQCVKRLLYRVLKEEAPRLETFRSVMIEAENIINNRPLTQLPVDAEAEEPLTPNHFLLGGVSSTQTPNTEEERTCLRKQWRIAQNLKDRLWKRWVVEYLPQLLRRPKWRNETPALQPGQLVIILDPSLPRSQWQMGRITRTFGAKDGHVRSAEVKTPSGFLRRPSVRLATLNFHESSQ